MAKESLALEMDASESAGVRIPPPLIFLTGLAAGAAIDRVLPFAPGYASYAGFLLVIAGVALDVWAAAEFRKAKTTILPWGRASLLVPAGPYRFTRNPMYLGMAMSYLGLAIAVGSWWALALLPVALLAITFYVIRREERHLEARFGEEYLAYKERVRRWL